MDLDVQRARASVTCLYILHRRKKNKINKIPWVLPSTAEREIVGAYYTTFKQLRDDRSKFFNHFCMSIESFDELVQHLQSRLQKQNTKMRNSISPTEKIAVTLRYLASGCSFVDLHRSYRLGATTVQKLVREVCVAIWNILYEMCFMVPSKENWHGIATGFANNANFPNCIGALDGKHIRIVRQDKSGSIQLSTRNYYSIVLMAVADSEYKFSFVDVGSYGKDCDPAIFKTTSFWRELDNDNLHLPDPKPLEGRTQAVPYVLVADEIFGLSKNLLRPYGGNQLNTQKRVFNYRVRRTKRYVDCAFGILTNKWQIFHRPFNVSDDFAIDVVKACCMLHNYVLDRDGYDSSDTYLITGLDDMLPSQTLRGGMAANNIRNEFVDYCNSDVGSLSWQLSKI